MPDTWIPLFANPETEQVKQQNLDFQVSNFELLSNNQLLLLVINFIRIVGAPASAPGLESWKQRQTSCSAS